MMELDLTVTNSATGIGSLTAQYVPNAAQYVAIVNPHNTASIAFTIAGTPAINAKGITLGPLGSLVFDNPAGSVFPIGSLNFISSTASQSATILYM